MDCSALSDRNRFLVSGSAGALATSGLIIAIPSILVALGVIKVLGLILSTSILAGLIGQRLIKKKVTPFIPAPVPKKEDPKPKTIDINVLPVKPPIPQQADTMPRNEAERKGAHRTNSPPDSTTKSTPKPAEKSVFIEMVSSPIINKPPQVLEDPKPIHAKPANIVQPLPPLKVESPTSPASDKDRKTMAAKKLTLEGWMNDFSATSPRFKTFKRVCLQSMVLCLHSIWVIWKLILVLKWRNMRVR